MKRKGNREDIPDKNNVIMMMMIIIIKSNDLYVKKFKKLREELN